ncbi:hypothetical protein ACWDUM_25380 [Rhodococcus sp. NPDC003322]
MHDTDYPDMRMPFQNGTVAWAESYHRHPGIESVFADLKQNRLHVHHGYFRGFGISRYTSLVGFTLAAPNLLNLHDWYSKRERLDPWGQFLGEAEPARTICERPRRVVPRRHEETSVSSRVGR